LQNKTYTRKNEKKRKRRKDLAAPLTRDTADTPLLPNPWIAPLSVGSGCVRVVGLFLLCSAASSTVSIDSSVD
jgi:hypothetical protein